MNTRPSGTVAFYNAQTGQLLGVVGLPTSGPTTGVAQFTIAGGLSLGNYTFFVAYSGDQDFAAAASGVNLQVTPNGRRS